MVPRARRAGEQIFTKKSRDFPIKDLNVMSGGQLNTTIRPMTGSRKKVRPNRSTYTRLWPFKLP